MTAAHSSTIKQALTTAQAQLTSLDINHNTAFLEAQYLLAHYLNTGKTYLLAHPEQMLTAQDLSAYQHLIQRRIDGEPIAYILGHKAFWDLDLMVNSNVLIPRPETELLVELILGQTSKDSSKIYSVLELGTGSGAIALALASERPHWSITATDIAESALAIARQNAAAHQLNQVKFFQGNWFNAISDPGLDVDNHSFDFIVSNPPYIAQNDLHLTQGDLRFEPQAALASGVDGLDDIRLIIKQANHFLKPQGRLLLEHGYNQAEAVRKLFTQYNYQQIGTVQDLAGLDRVSWGVGQN